MVDRYDIGRALQGFGAGVAGRGPQFLQQLDENRKNALVKDAFQVQQLLGGDTPDVSGARQMLMQRVELINRLGGDPSDTMGVLSKLDAGDAAGALRDVTTVVDHAVREGRLKPPNLGINQQVSAPKKVRATLADGSEVNGSVVIKFNPATGQPESEFIPDVGAVDPNDITKVENVGTLGLTGQEQIDERQADRVQLAQEQARLAKEKAISDKKVTREQGFIDEAISVGEVLPEMKRAYALLADVKTGGIQAALIRAKQLFGIEAADEGELSSKLGVAVLARLRQTFGAQFTEREGKRLEGVSARMGANAATNVRILESTIKRMEREIKRGLRFATNYEDDDAIDLLNDYLEFTYDAAPESGEPGAAGDTLRFDAQGNPLP